MNLTSLSIRHRGAIFSLVVAMICSGLFFYGRMNKDLFPSLGVPTIYVAQPYGGMDPAQMEGYLTYYYEYHFLYITGIEHVESKSIQGAALIKLQFHPGTDMAQAMSETVGYVNRARAFMPPGTVPPFITRFDSGSVPVGYLVFSSDTKTVAQMQDAALNLVRPLFATLPGVSAPPPFGGSARAIVVNLKKERLESYGMSPDEVVTALSLSNLIAPSGNMTIGSSFPSVPLNSVVKNIKDLENIPIRSNSYPAIYVRDVAEVQDASDLTTCFALVNGRRTVYIPVTKRSDASTLSVVALVRQNLSKFQSVLPEEIKVSYEFDQSHLVEKALRGVIQEGLLGACLTALMVLLFLRDLRSALIVFIHIPVTLLMGVVGLSFFKETINLMTLGGLALAVGILVDEVTVTLESFHSFREKGMSVKDSILQSADQTAIPRLLAMLMVIAVFIPTFFMGGVGQALFAPLALAVGFSMAASYFLSSTFVPVLLKTIQLDKSLLKPEQPKEFNFEKKLQKLISLRALVLLLYLILTGGVIWLIHRGLGSEIFPRIEAHQIQIRFRAPPGTRVELTESQALKIIDLVKKEVGPEGVTISMGFVGVHAPSFPVNYIHLWNGGPEEGVLQFQFKKELAISTYELQEKLRGRFANEIPDVLISFEASDLISRMMSFGSSTPVEIAVSGADLTKSREFAETLLTKLRTVPSLRDLQIRQTFDYPQVDVQIDREKAGIMGIRASEIARSLVTATSSSRFVVPNYWADPKTGVSYQIQVQIPSVSLKSVEDLRNVPIATVGGSSIPLRSVASVGTSVGVGQYERYNMQRQVTVQGTFHGRDLGGIGQEIQKILATAGSLPPKTFMDVRGEIATLKIIQDGFVRGLLLSVFVIALLLFAYFESFWVTFCILMMVPSVVFGSLLSLFLTSMTLNIQSGMGIIMSLGVSLANAVMIASVFKRESGGAQGEFAPAIMAVGSRLRPVLMTSCSMVAGMIPMALAIGEGGGQMAPLGRAVIGGIIFSTGAVLGVLPCLLSFGKNKYEKTII